ncbi:flagellar hook-basal body complex protein FliE [Sphingomonas sp. ID0503]|uniref:flagellar hook-basal body complex protein FliE n=1 Tax=Sphingomonas sp. ID0503 TaxID=3399691 RepID=UPI003AFAC890
MSGIGGVGGIDANRIMSMRAQILERNQALSKAAEVGAPAETTTSTSKAGGGFGDALKDALKSVNETQNAAGRVSDSYERGENVDVAQVMLSRQKASISFEATLQVRNKLLSAYKDIMSMPV